MQHAISTLLSAERHLKSIWYNICIFSQDLSAKRRRHQQLPLPAQEQHRPPEQVACSSPLTGRPLAKCVLRLAESPVSTLVPVSLEVLSRQILRLRVTFWAGSLPLTTAPRRHRQGASEDGVRA